MGERFVGFRHPVRVFLLLHRSAFLLGSIEELAGQTAEAAETITRLRAQIELVEAMNAELAPFRLLTGIEVDINPDGAKEGPHEPDHQT